MKIQRGADLFMEHRTGTLGTINEEEESIMVRPKLRLRHRRHLLALTWVGMFLPSFGLLVWNNLRLESLITTANAPPDHPMDRAWVKPNPLSFNQHHEISHDTNHLIIVAIHSVIVSGHLHDADHDEKDWFLLDYQKGQGLPEAIVSHIAEGIRRASMDPHSLLVFSGAGPGVQPGPINGGTSYYQVADAMNLWKGNVRARSATEDNSLDSFQNLLFAICRFKEITERYPDHITVVSFGFKRRRFQELHAPALLWPPNKFTYVGIDPDSSTGFDVDRATKGEVENSARPFESDPYGCHSDVLVEKRRERNPFHITPPYELSCPDMKSLLNWCDPSLIPASQVPW